MAPFPPPVTRHSRWRSSPAASPHFTTAEEKKREEKRREERKHKRGEKREKEVMRAHIFSSHLHVGPITFLFFILLTRMPHQRNHKSILPWDRNRTVLYSLWVKIFFLLGIRDL
jgi:hypothetical protein